MPRFTDLLVLDSVRKRSDGSLVASATVARTGIQIYAGFEVGKPDVPVVNVYRPPEEVFSRDSMASFAHRPVTNDHPTEMVTSDNWKDVAVGNTSDEVMRDGNRVRVPLMISDGAAISDYEGGKRQLSSGYTADLEFTPGTTPEGEKYDAIQRNIRANHVAIVQRGRAGPTVGIGDSVGSTWGASPIHLKTKDKTMPETNTRTVVVDGLSVITTDQGAQAIEKLTRERDEARANLTTSTASHSAEIQAKDGEIGALKVELQKAKDSAPKAADIDKLVADRAELVSIVGAIDSKIEVSGKTDAELRKAAVASKLGDAMVADASDAEIAGMFKAVARDVKTGTSGVSGQSGPSNTTVQRPTSNFNGSNHSDAFRSLVRQGPSTGEPDAYAKRVAAQTDAWKQPKSA